MVSVLVNGHGPFPFLVDTAATTSVIADALARNLGIETHSEAEFHSSSGASRAPTARIARLDIGRRQLSGLTVLVLQGSNIGAAGILGLDALRGQALVLDFARKRVLLQPPSPAPQDSLNVTLAAHALSNGMLIVRSSIDGQPVNLVIDTGSQDSVANAALLRLMAAGEKDRIRLIGPRTIRSVDGAAVHGNMGIVRNLAIGTLRISRLPLLFSEIHTFRSLRISQEPAILLGASTLRSFDRVTLDYRHRRVTFELPDKDSPPLVDHRSGLVR